MGFACVILNIAGIGGLQPIPGDQKDNDMTAMLDDRASCFVIQHGRPEIPLSFWIFRDWLETTYSPFNWLSETEAHQEDISRMSGTCQNYEKGRICMQIKKGYGHQLSNSLKKSLSQEEIQQASFPINAIL